MNIEERVKQAKLDIDSGGYDKPLHKKRMEVKMVNCGGVNLYGFFGNGKHEAPHTSRLQPHESINHDYYPASLYGTPENEYSYY